MTYRLDSPFYYLYKEVLEAEPPRLNDLITPKSSQRLPEALTKDDVQRLLRNTSEPTV